MAAPVSEIDSRADNRPESRPSTDNQPLATDPQLTREIRRLLADHIAFIKQDTAGRQAAMERSFQDQLRWIILLMTAFCVLFSLLIFLLVS
jgi:hypothetical protein